jgi:predicted metalloprotease
MPRPVAILIALCCSLISLTATGIQPVGAHVPLRPYAFSAAAAESTAEQAASSAARAISRLEAKRDFAAIYRRMHPDSRVEAPQEAVVGWYDAEFSGKRTAELTVTDVQFIDWTWAVTGETYPRTAAVSYTQPYWIDGVREAVPGVIHLVESNGAWGWFFGNSRDFVDAQIARYADASTSGGGTSTNVAGDASDTIPVDYVSALPDELDRDVDDFWAGAFAKADEPYTPPAGVVSFDASIDTACGPARPVDTVAFYCPADRTIYYASDFRGLVETDVGDFGWVTVVAHEWGHHIQAQLGLLNERAAQSDGGEASVEEIELQADCLAGAYARDAERRAWLEPGDLDEALLLTAVAGDPPGTPTDDPNAHGSGTERVAAFTDGYDDGLAGCDLAL